MVRTLCHSLILAVALTIAFSSSARAQQGITMEVVAFSPEKDLYALRIMDVDRGNYFSIRKLDEGEKVKDVAYEIETEERIWKQLVKKYELTEEAVISQASPDGRFTLLGAPKGPKYRIMVNGNGKVGTLMDIDLQVDEQSKEVAKGMLKQVAWNKKGKWVVLIVNQRLGGNFPMDRDFAYQTKFRSFRVKWSN